MTEIMSIDIHPLGTIFERSRAVVGSGGVIVFPTETFYGLGADPRNVEAVRRVFDIKGREQGKPILLLIPDASFVGDWVEEITPEARRLMDAFWPGPLTIIFSAKKNVSEELTAGTGSIGLRVPGSGVTRRLLSFMGMALTGTSANTSGRPAPVSAQQAADDIGEKVDLIIDCGSTPGGLSSTVIDARRSPLRIVREGAVPLERLKEHVRIEG